MSQPNELDSDDFESSDSFLSIDKILPDDSDDEESSSSNSDGPQRSGRVRKVSRKVASQLSQSRALAQQKAEAAERKGKGRKVRKSKLKEVSQLLDEMNYTL